MPDQFLYKQRFFTGMLLLGYAYLHYLLCLSPSVATSEMLLLGQAPLPYAQRMLIPSIEWLAHSVIPGNVASLFLGFELLFTGLLYLMLNKLMETAFEVKAAKILTWLFFLLLPLITLINYRITVGGEAAIFYVYDTPTLFFMTAGYYCCLKQRYAWLYLVIFAATLNRETGVLLVLLIPALHWQDRKKIIMPVFYSLLCFLLAKSIILFCTRNTPGVLLGFYVLNTPDTLFAFNLKWLFAYHNILLFLFCIAGLPFLWFTFYEYIPLEFRPIRYLLLAYFIGLLCVALVPETRVFSEIAVLLYLPVCIALRDWGAGMPPLMPDKKGLWYFVDRYVVIGALVALVLFNQIINQAITAVTSHP